MAVNIKPYLCKVCNWSGIWPSHTWVKREGKLEQVIFLCPDCNSDVKEIVK